MLETYAVVGLFTVIAAGLCLLIYGLTFLRAPHRPNLRKNAAYECGFDQISSVNQRFHVRYGIVAILFVLFDLEIAFLLPWCLQIATMSAYAFGVGIGFLFLILVGFYYEWVKGALDWY